MCSTCDCDQEVPRPENRSEDVHLMKKKCRKCAGDPFIVLDKVHVECRQCFLESCNKKIRSTIGRSGLIKNNDSVLIAHSGGSSSWAILDLVNNSMQYDVGRREQKFRPSILHIDTQAAFCQPDIELTSRIHNLCQLLQETHRIYPDWPLYWTTLEMSTLSNDCDDLYLRYDTPDDLSGSKAAAILSNVVAMQNLSSMLKNSDDLTDQLECLRKHTNHLTDRVANNMNLNLPDKDRFKFLFTGSSATQLANELMVDVILGQGASMRSVVGVCDRRLQVPVMRPLREFSKKEIAFYLKARNMSIPVRTNISSLSSGKSSIQRATEAFLSKLYVDYPSTYNTLLRTGNKMQD